MVDVIDSTHMPINKGNAHGTQRERTNGVNFQHSILLAWRYHNNKNSILSEQSFQLSLDLSLDLLQLKNRD